METWVGLSGGSISFLGNISGGLGMRKAWLGK